jgi:Cys-tRNA(Pro)/Cys-tRNA(Cys) deacylase
MISKGKAQRRRRRSLAKKTSAKTNAMRMLDAAGISYGMAEYEVDESDLSGVHAADELGVPAETVFKTLVARGDGNELFVFIIPVAENLDLKKAASASGNKRIEMIHVKELFDLTGYVRGGCSPIGMKKTYPTYIDETAQLYDEIYFSAGRRGAQIILDPDKLCEVTGAEYADITKV